MARIEGGQRTRGRIGRPPKELAGEVEQRILDAAQRLFLERGFGGASVDEIAEAARASKPTIYARFPDKEALFAAVVTRFVKGLMEFEDYAPSGRTVRDKLVSLGAAIVERAIEDSVAVMRVMIAEAQRFPELSRRLHDVARNGAASAVSQLLNTHAPTSKEPFSSERNVALAQIFMDLILVPMLMRCLLGEEAKALRKELPSFVRERVRVFLAACEKDWTR